MATTPNENRTCVVIGASHAGVAFAFALRNEGWSGRIVLYDADPQLPYQRPPLSKAFLAGTDDIEQYALQPRESYERAKISLYLGMRVAAIERATQHVTLADGSRQPYDDLVLATGARAFLPPIPGLLAASNLYPLRTAGDARDIRDALTTLSAPRVVIIGGGYIGLETAASLRKAGATVTVLEREERVLARVTAPAVSAFFHELHRKEGVAIRTGAEVTAIRTTDDFQEVCCADGSRIPADLIVVGVGIRVNTELAAAAGLTVDNGIKVDAATRTSDPNILAIGDCTCHHNPHYGRYVRLESVQNAVDQAKVAAATVAGKEAAYAKVPWFWSDQYDIKLQMVGLAAGHDEVLLRREEGDSPKFSAWYFRGDQLLAVDAINDARAYVIGTRLITGGQRLDKAKIKDPGTALKPAILLADGSGLRGKD